MKRIKALIISLILSIIISFTFLTIYKKKLSNIIVDNNSIKYSTSYNKYNSHDVLVNNIDKNTILLMGSSELGAGIDFEEHPRQILNFSDKSIMQIGGAYYQSLIHAIILGSIGNEIPVKTVNFILSMQWFDKKGLDPGALQLRFSIDHLNHLYENNKLSEKLKSKICDRILELSKQNEFNKDYIKTLTSKSIIDKYLKDLYFKKYSLVSDYKFYKDYKLDESVNKKKFSNINWEKLKKEAIKRAESETTNNKFYIKNDYYDEYIKNRYFKLKDSSKNVTFSESPEYDDLQIFLSVAKELGFKVNLIMVPLQGYWADYTGVKKSEIEKFYTKIRNIAKDNNVNLVDYSSYSYEPYFFKDIMHLGRLGYLRLTEDLLRIN